MSETNGDNARYLVGPVMRACDILEAFKSEGELLRLREIADRSNLSAATAFRLMRTLERRGLIEKASKFEYRLAIRPLKRWCYRFGFGSHTAEFAFSKTVAESIARAATRNGIGLLVLDNKYSAKSAIRNVETFIRQRVDLVVEFQADEHVAAPVIGSKLLEANIPFIAVEIPHPGASCFGGNNYAAGLMGGRYLGRWAKNCWSAKVDEVLLLELPISGPLPASRLEGAVTGLREVLGGIEDLQIVRLNGNGRFGASLEAVRKHLGRSRANHVLVVAINDPSAIGAARAFEEAGRATACGVLGFNASVDARAELRRPHSRLVGSVGFFPEEYGDGIVALALDILNRRPSPPAVFTRHQIISSKNVDQLYFHDPVLSADQFETMLW
jgi:ribose transport system substrate-binding protein